MVLAGAIPDREKKVQKMLVTGLEGLLAEFSVDLTGSRILAARDPNASPVNVFVTANPMSRNPVAEVLNQLPPVDACGNVRRGADTPTRSRGGSPYQADEFLEVFPMVNRGIWTNDDMNDDGSELLRQALIQEDKSALEKIDKLLSDDPLPVGVAVSESDQRPDPMNPHAGLGGDSTPRLVVIGNARFASDQVLGGSGSTATYSYALVASSLAWLREKPAGIGIPPIRASTIK